MIKYFKIKLALFILIFSILPWISSYAFADVQFDSIELNADQPFMTEIPRLKDKSLVCDMTSIYWMLIESIKIRGSGFYRLNGTAPTLYQVVARDESGRHIVAHDGSKLLRFAQINKTELPRRFVFEIRLSDLCMANRDRHFAPDDFLAYVLSLRLAVAPVSN
jgi:hypothetical protein